MPDVSHSYSVYAPNEFSATHTFSVSTAQLRSHTFSVSAVIVPERFHKFSVETVPNGGVYIGHNFSVYAYFIPADLERFHTFSVVTVPSVEQGSFHTFSVNTAFISEFTLTHTFSVLVAPPDPLKSHTFSVVSQEQDLDTSHSFSVVKQGMIEKVHFFSVYTVPPVSKTHLFSVVAHKLNAEIAHTFSVRPFIDISPGEHSVRNTDINLLIGLVNDRDAILALLDELNDRLTFDLAEIIRLVGILNQVTNKPSCLLSSVSPSTNVPRLGGVTMSVFGDEFIPTCEVHLFQGVTEILTTEAHEVSKTNLTFTLPDFTAVVGIVLTNPISIEVLNADGEVSETITFTLAAS